MFESVLQSALVCVVTNVGYYKHVLYRCTMATFTGKTLVLNNKLIIYNDGHLHYNPVTWNWVFSQKKSSQLMCLVSLTNPHTHLSYPYLLPRGVCRIFQGGGGGGNYKIFGILDIHSRASSGVNYVLHIRSYLEHYSFQNITPANYNNLWSVYCGFNLFTNNGHHYNIVDSP